MGHQQNKSDHLCAIQHQFRSDTLLRPSLERFASLIFCLCILVVLWHKTMDSTLEEDHLGDLPKSHFPGAPRRDINDHHYESFSISILEESYSPLGKRREIWEELVQATWAVLLRSYLQDDTVSFAVLLGGQSSSISKKQANTDALVLQYEISEACRLKDIRVAKCWKTTRKVLKTSQINTALNILAPLSGLKNGELAKSATAQHNLPIDKKVSLFFIGVTMFLDEHS